MSRSDSTSSRNINGSGPGAGLPMSGDHRAMISPYAICVLYLHDDLIRNRCSFGTRVMLVPVTLLAVWLAIYRPVTGYLQAHCFMPLRVREHVVVVRPHYLPREIKRGDRILYS